MNDDKYIGVLLEQILDEVKAVHKLVADRPARAEFIELLDDMRAITDDVKTTKAAVADLSRQVSGPDKKPGQFRMRTPLD